MKADFYPALDGLRALAVGIVLLAHAGVPWFVSGGVGVDVFFVLSGFLITGILAREFDATGRVHWRHFYLRRLLRLGPALVLACALVAWTVPRWFHAPLPDTELALALSYTMNWAMAADHPLPWLGHCWSLAMEEQFYLLWPGVVWLLHRRLRGDGARAAALLGAAGIVAVYRAAMVGTFTPARINYGFDTRIDTILLGGALAYALRTARDVGLPEGWSRGLGWGLSPAAVAGILTVPRFLTWHDPAMARIGFVTVALASGLVIADLVQGRHSLLAIPLSWAPVRWLGRISYGIYLFHMLVYYAVDARWRGMSLGGSMAIKLAGSVALAALSYHFVERHFLRWKSRLAPARARAGIRP